SPICVPHTSPPSSHTLSLHDALPICRRRQPKIPNLYSHAQIRAPTVSIAGGRCLRSKRLPKLEPLHFQCSVADKKLSSQMKNRVNSHKIETYPAIIDRAARSGLRCVV